jgi:hypothetical protein
VVFGHSCNQYFQIFDKLLMSPNSKQQLPQTMK